MYKRQEALRAIADGQNPNTLPSPFANSGAQTEVHHLYIHVASYEHPMSSSSDAGSILSRLKDNQLSLGVVMD